MYKIVQQYMLFLEFYQREFYDVWKISIVKAAFRLKTIGEMIAKAIAQMQRQFSITSLTEFSLLNIPMKVCKMAQQQLLI